MNQTYNIYCDESCHLEHDGQKAMVLGAVWCPMDNAREIAVRLRELKGEYKLGLEFETKWNKVSPAKVKFYEKVVDYFFDDDDLHFRCVVIPEKTQLAHDAHNQDHDAFYYKMMFTLIAPLLTPNTPFRIYLDLKDTKGGAKARKLHDVLCNAKYDFKKDIIQFVQIVQSHDVEQLQLTDLLTGAMGYVHRELKESTAKLRLIERIRKRTGYSLRRTTLLGEKKFNILVWQSKVPTGGAGAGE